MSVVVFFRNCCLERVGSKIGAGVGDEVWNLAVLMGLQRGQWKVRNQDKDSQGGYCMKDGRVQARKILQDHGNMVRTIKGGGSVAGVLYYAGGQVACNVGYYVLSFRTP